MDRSFFKEFDNKKSNKMIRSAKLRKYASVYKSYIRKSEQLKMDKSPPRPRRKKDQTNENPEKNKKKITDSNITKRKSLNKYQKFVKEESKKEKYKKLPGKERLSVIASEWKRINKMTY